MTRHAIVVLLPAATDAEAARASLAAAVWMADDMDVLVAPDAVRGTGLWTNQDTAAQWWEGHHLDACEVALVIRDHAGLEHELRTLDTRWAVWCTDPARVDAYAGAPQVTAISADNAATFSAHVVTALTVAGWNIPQRPTWGPFRRSHVPPEQAGAADSVEQPAMVPAEATPLTSESVGTAAEPRIAPAGHVTDPTASATDPPPLPVLEWGNPPRLVPQRPLTPVRPASLAVAPDPTATRHPRVLDDGGIPDRPGHATRRSKPLSRTPRRSIRDRLAGALGGNGSDTTKPVDIAELAQALTRSHDTIVYVGSRKGGVGKTTESLALGFLAAQAVEALGGSTVAIEANVTNADIAVKLHLPDTAPTVRDVVGALMHNRPAPPPAAARGSAMRVYGEHRETERYTPTEIASLADHLRAFYTLSVIDGPNAIPGWEGKAESVVEAWLPHADVVVIPLDTSTASFEGAADMLSAINDIKESSDDTYSPGVVIAFLSPQDLVARQVAPHLAATLEELEAVGARIVDIPQSSWMGMVEWSDHPVPLTDVDPAVTRAYWRLLAAVVDGRPPTLRVVD